MNLPFDLWNQKIFEGIGNSIEIFIKIDDLTKAQSLMISFRFFIMVEFGVKLPTSITLEVEIKNIKQELRYEPNNFMFSLCNQVFHIMRSFPKRIL